MFWTFYTKKHYVPNIFILKNYSSEIEIQLGVQYSDLTWQLYMLDTF